MDRSASGRKADHLRIAARARRRIAPATPGWTPCGCATGRCPGATWATSSLRCELLGAPAARPADRLGDDRRDRGGRAGQRARWPRRRRARIGARARLGPRAARRPGAAARPTAGGRPAPAAPARQPRRRPGARRGRDRASRALVDLLDADGPDDPPQPDPGGGPARGRAGLRGRRSRGSPRSRRASRRGRSSSRRSASAWTARTSRLLAEAGVAAVDVAGRRRARTGR